LRLRVTWEQGAGCSVRAEKHWTVERLKAAIHEESGVSVQEQRLYYDTGRRGLVELFEDQTLDLIRGSRADICLVRGHPRRVEWLKRVALDWQSLQDAPKALRDDWDTVLTALEHDGRALQWASDKLRDDRDAVRFAVEQCPYALEYASEGMRGDWDIVMAALKQDVHAICFAAESVRSDRELMLQAVTQNGALLEFAPDALRADREVVLAAVMDSGAALQFASEELRGDRDLAMAAVQEHPFALEHVVPELACDPELIELALKGPKGQEDAPKEPAIPEAYRWMGLSREALRPAPAKVEEDPPPRKAFDWWEKADAALEEVSLDEDTRLRFAAHWLLEPGPTGALVHRLEEGLRLSPPRSCSDCIFGRHLWCVQCGPAAMPEAEEAMKRWEGMHKGKLQAEKDKVEKFLGNGLFFSEMDLRSCAFKGVPI